MCSYQGRQGQIDLRDSSLIGWRPKLCPEKEQLFLGAIVIP